MIFGYRKDFEPIINILLTFEKIYDYVKCFLKSKFD